jgi:apyrase
MKTCFFRLFLFVCIYLTSVSMPCTADSPAESYEHAVVVDAGSSGNRVWIYKWRRERPAKQLTQYIPVKEIKLKPKLSDLQDDMPGVTTLLTSVMKEAKNYTPVSIHNTTRFFFYATAGMRLLDERKAENMFIHINSLLSSKAFCPFRFDSTPGARIISSKKEGAFMWLTVNYLSGLLRDDAVSNITRGMVLLGGMSTQITFLSGIQTLRDNFSLSINSNQYILYSHRYFNYGQAAVDNWIKAKLKISITKISDVVRNPCMLKGDTYVSTDGVTFNGTGDPSKCNNLLKNIVRKVTADKCPYKPCAIGSTYQPPVPVHMPFYVLGGFYAVLRDLRALGDQGSFTLLNARENALRFCRQDMATLARTHPEIEKDFLSKTCMAGLYAVTLLNRGYGFAMDSDKLFAVDKIKEQSISWTLGALILANKPR